MSNTELDVIGIGFGPGNLSLAVALEERWPGIRAVYLEARPEPSWQPGMMLDRSDIQNNPVRDLVSPVDPRSRYSFLNYLHETGRLFEYLNLGLEYPFRLEYARYITWAAEIVGADVRYGTHVEEVVSDGLGYALVRSSDGREFRAPAVVVAPGRTPRVPAVFAGLGEERAVHFTKYLEAVAGLDGARPRIAVIGGSQSAVELLLDLRSRFPEGEIRGIVRSFGFRQKDTSPFMDEVYLPGFVDYYYKSSEDSKRALSQDLRFTNYSAADIDVIRQLYVTMYEDRMNDSEVVRLNRNTDVISCEETAKGLLVRCRERHTGELRELEVDLVILATGFLDLGAPGSDQQFLPPILDSFADRVRTTSSGHASIARDYRLELVSGDDDPTIYLNGLCETSHGMGDAGSFSLLSVRAEELARSMSKNLRRAENVS